ncbi:gliding motility lipoprotein GldH [Winogradskyella sp. 3972H.M.0a.05]|uniref:gliding motility lipoprotein GldH n=1 Tax=Winogradskyella sp. 3972H.M.0a.05 TaxID=2950277 RepID=UPI003391C3D6
MLKKNSWIISLLLVCFACDSNQIFDAYESFPNKWHKDEVVSFSMTPPDSTQAYNLYVNIRNNNDYRFNNLFLIVELNYPNGKAIKDTLKYKMAAPDGTLLGTGFSDVKENKLWYKGYESPFVFNETGEYTINIQHAMRENGKVDGVENLEGITDVGFRVESIKSN